MDGAGTECPKCLGRGEMLLSTMYLGRIYQGEIPLMDLF